jgi:nitrite reductase/ring-hydroxylating ferredoxin subunit
VKALCKVDALAEDFASEFEVGERRLLAWRKGTDVRVVLNRCPHFNVPMNVEFGRVPVFGGLLTCVHHYSYFRFEDGACVEGQCVGASLDAVPFKIVDGEVSV